ncbi:hypothetical protein EMIHUDRAFT_217273 [Emiliania huxleyi CCMP1516]|uniref:RNA-binding S4 domain-containing protein n=2 Tax=Emiliania huxleyi TaxID=2903 RepID=A0A0D3IBD3_EMIH1|nr:hypothetical protein EMIHUDRAFT_217273 [Emiliania huxleyi CCMP1516]EOD08568.1 hypothetical protein EMIHUDRAFT_217273 [Emiliania huxleyi CCMP1516]|eukprot:XP_005760997.1 hypothetical protein EMIHUDRAFT_217273 [Emiliania huxleyi CCMP1516]
MVRLDHALRAWATASSEHSVPLKQAQQRIRRGEVSVDGTVVTEPRHQVVPGVESIACDGSPVPAGEHSFCLMHKPPGYICQRHPRDPSVYDLVPEHLRRPDLAACGRLDRDTTGMLLFATDGGVQSLLLHPTSRAVLQEDCSALRPGAQAAFEAGMQLADGLQCAPAGLEAVGASTVRVRVHEGHFHQAERFLSGRCTGTRLERRLMGTWATDVTGVSSQPKNVAAR